MRYECGDIDARKSVSTEMRLEVRCEGSEAASQEVICRERIARRDNGVPALTCTCAECAHPYSLQSALMRAFIHRS